MSVIFKPFAKKKSNLQREKTVKTFVLSASAVGSAQPIKSLHLTASNFCKSKKNKEIASNFQSTTCITLKSKVKDMPSAILPTSHPDSHLWQWLSFPDSAAATPPSAAFNNADPASNFLTNKGLLQRKNLTSLNPFDTHFRRPPPGSTLISWPSKTHLYTFKVLNLHPSSNDLNLLHNWMNLDRVNRFWGEAGPKEHQERYIKTLPWHMIPLIGYVDGVPFGYFEHYWARPDRINAYHPTSTYDKGFHVLVGLESALGLFNEWVYILMIYAFESDPRATMIFAEPRVDNRKLIASCLGCGFETLEPGEIQMPHKRSALLGLRRATYERVVRGKVGLQNGVKGKVVEFDVGRNSTSRL
ncbi:hypothetical protein HDV05_008630 [Chytridiales sp. JEL 0842]|nr:hypothetical protein HDV05_008630 [Chytridiales sp. JEL 0842]